jgi:hypothetical protein
MYTFFEKIFSEQPKEIIGNDFYYNTDNEGDQFDETNEDFWLNQDGFKDNWEGTRQNRLEAFTLCDEIASEIANGGKPFLEIACGPGMGLAPAILKKIPDCRAWRRTLAQG